MLKSSLQLKEGSIPNIIKHLEQFTLLSFNEHIDDITRKSYKMLGFIFRCGKFFTKQSSMMQLFNALVRSRLEYCSSVWSPFYDEAVDQIERVQKKFSRMFYFKFNLESPRPNYDVRLKNLKLHSLESRRLENDEIMLHKLIHNHIDSKLIQRIYFHRPLREMRHTPVFYLPKMITNYQHNSPIYRLQRNHDKYFSNLNIHDARLFVFKKSVREYFDFWLIIELIFVSP